ncbi:hypothetical protein AB0H29_11240 [Streptomyces thermolilacinus]
MSSAGPPRRKADEPVTYQEKPVELPLDPALGREPEPVQGCKICAALEYDRALAKGRRDWSAVSDCNVRMRDHQHREMFR